MDPPAGGITPGQDPSNLAAPEVVSAPGDQNGASIDLDSMTQEQLEAMLLTGKAPVEKPPANEDPPVNGTEDGDDLETPPANAQPDTKPRRIRMNVGDLPEDDVNRMFQIRDMVKRGEATDALDAMRKLTGTTEPTPPQASEKPLGETTPPAESAPSSKVQAIQQKIESLRQQRADARTVEFDFAKADALSDEITEAMVELNEAKREGQQNESQINEWAQQEAEALATVTREFPDLRDEGSPLYEEYAAQYALAMAHQDPVFNSPDWSQQLAQRAQARLAKLTGQAPPAPSPPPTGRPTAQPTPRPIRPVGSLGGSGSDGPPLNGNQLQSLIESADDETLEAALNAPDEAATASLLLQRRRR